VVCGVHSYVSCVLHSVLVREIGLCVILKLVRLFREVGSTYYFRWEVSDVVVFFCSGDVIFAARMIRGLGCIVDCMCGFVVRAVSGIHATDVLCYLS